MTRFIRFLFVGALNTAIGYGIFAGLVLAGMAPTPALVATYVVGTLVNYMTTGGLVFRGSRGSLVKFVAAYVVIYFFNLALFHAMTRIVPGPLAAQAICVPAVAVFSYLLFKAFVFRPQRP